MLEGMLATPHVVQSWPKCGSTQLPNSQLMILCNINTLPNSLPNRFSLPEPGHRDLTLQLDSKEWRPHFGVLSRLQNCLNTVLEFLALNYSHQDKGLKCEVIVRWTKEPAQRTVLYSFSYNSYFSYNIWRANQPDEEELTTTTLHSSTWSYTVF